MDLRKKIVQSVKKGVSKSETAQRFGVHRATVKRYCKRLDEHGTLEPAKAPGKASKLDEKARKLLLEDLEQQRPWATHSQRAEFLAAVAGVSVSEATVCRAIKRLSHSRKKDPEDQPERDEFLRLLWRNEIGRIDPERLVFVDEMGTHTSLAPLYDAYAPVGERAFLKLPRNRGTNTTLLFVASS